MKINWTADMLERLGKASDKVLALDYGIHTSAVARKRAELGIARFDKYAAVGLGSAPDAVIAEQLGVGWAAIAQARRRKGVAAWQPQERWTDEQVALLGKTSDADVGQQVGRSRGAVYAARRERGIPAYDEAASDKRTA